MNLENFKKENQDYIQNKVNPFFEKLLYDLLLNKPQDIFAYVSTWLEENKLKFQNNSFSQIQINTSQQKKKEENNKKVDKKLQESQGSSESDEDDEVEIIPNNIGLKAPVAKIQRSSVSAEAYGNFNKKGNFQARVIPKTEEQKKRIKDKLQKAFMFQALDEKETEIVINAMEEKKFSKGSFIIKQGEDGDNLYVVDSGQLDCYKKFGKNADDTFLKTYQPGESFGELALLYNAPRAATIKAKTDSVLFALDRECFNNIVKESAVKRRQKYEDFLCKVEILKSMDPYERGQLADVLKTQNYKKGEYIIKQGEVGDTFYMIEDGELYAEKIMNPGEKAKEVYNYKVGDYFGELALLKDIPRQASVVCRTDSLISSLDKKSFLRLLGPVEKILERNIENYSKYK